MNNHYIYFVTTASSAVAMTASFNSSAIDISMVRCVAIQAVWTGATSAGASDVVIVQGSLDQSTWTTVSSTSTNATSGDILLNIESPAYPYLRVGFTKSAAAAGTMTIKVAGKV